MQADGALLFGTARVATLVQAGETARRATLHSANVSGTTLVEARVFVGRESGRVSIVRIDNDAARIVVTSEFGPNTDGELIRSVTLDARGVVRSQATSGVSRCDGARPLFPEHFDLTTASWVPVPGDVPTAPKLAPHAAMTLPPPRRTLRFSSASVDGRSDRADRLAAPRELDDGNDATAYELGSGPWVRGAFVSAHAPRAVEVIAIRIAAPPAPSRLPQALVLIAGPHGRPVARLELSGETRWFALEPAQLGACVSFVVDEPAKGTTPVAIGEITLYSTDDKPDGLTQLAALVANDAPDSEGAARSLEEAGPVGAAAALAALGSSNGVGRRRLLQIVATHPQAVMPAAAHALATLLETAHEGERPLLVRILSSDPAAGTRAAAQLLADRSQAAEARRDALALLARIGGRNPEAVAILLRTAASDDELASEARRAVAEDLRRTPRLADTLLSELEALPTPVADDARGRTRSLVLLCSAAGSALSPDQRVRAVAVLERLRQTALPFELSVHVLSALGHIDPTAATAAASRTLSASNDPALRLHALSALPSPADAGAKMVLASATKDPDSRVRERALARLLATDGANVEMLRLRADDDWPQVRSVAYDGLGRACQAAPTQSSLLRTRVFGKGRELELDSHARSVALTAVSRCPDSSAELLASAISKHQPSEVRERAAQLLAGGGPDVLPTLTRSLDKVYRRGGAELPDTAVALLSAIGRVAAKASGKLDEQTLTLLRDSAADPFFPAIRVAAIDALATGCPMSAHVVFDRADQDLEPAVQRAAMLARRRCDK